MLSIILHSIYALGMPPQATLKALLMEASNLLCIKAVVYLLSPKAGPSYSAVGCALSVALSESLT